MSETRMDRIQRFQRERDEAREDAARLREELEAWANELESNMPHFARHMRALAASRPNPEESCDHATSTLGPRRWCPACAEDREPFEPFEDRPNPEGAA